MRDVCNLSQDRSVQGTTVVFSNYSLLRRVSEVLSTHYHSHSVRMSKWTGARRMIWVLAIQLNVLFSLVIMRWWTFAMWLVVEFVITTSELHILQYDYDGQCGFNLNIVTIEGIWQWHKVWWNLYYQLWTLYSTIVICEVGSSWKANMRIARW